MVWSGTARSRPSTPTALPSRLDELRSRRPTMVSAVFHSPTPAAARDVKTVATKPSAGVLPPEVPASPAEPAKPRIDGRELGFKVIPPLVGIALLVGIWALLTMKSTTFPTPAATFAEAVRVF